MRLIIESPYAAPKDLPERRRAEIVEDNINFCRNVCKYAMTQGHNPFASHIFYTQFLYDDIKEERDLGIKAGLDWGQFAEGVWICLRVGEEMSAGMVLGLERHITNGKSVYLKRFDKYGNFLQNECLDCGAETKSTYSYCKPCIHLKIYNKDLKK